MSAPDSLEGARPARFVTSDLVDLLNSMARNYTMTAFLLDGIPMGSVADALVETAARLATVEAERDVLANEVKVLEAAIDGFNRGLIGVNAVLFSMLDADGQAEIRRNNPTAVLP